jgi:exodeoxyribonuclease-3
MKALIAYARAQKEQGLKLVISGDYNIARTDMDVHPKERKPNIIGQRPEERELLEAMLAEGLVDVGRKLYPDDEEYFSWWAPWRNLRQRNIGWRLDYVLASEALAERAVSCPSYREIGTSDHAPVVATFE